MGKCRISWENVGTLTVGKWEYIKACSGFCGGLPFDIRGVTSILRCLRVSFQFLFSFQSEFKSFRTKSDLVI